MAAGLHRSTVSVVERGHWDALSFGTIGRVAAVLGVRLDLTARWRGGDMDRLLNVGHSAMHEVVAELFDDLPDWLRQPEVSFAVYGERGVIDILCFLSPTGSSWSSRSRPRSWMSRTWSAAWTGRHGWRLAWQQSEAGSHDRPLAG